jgi:predicted metal-dependent hydrolase
MSNDLNDLADKRGISADNSWTKIAFNEILGCIYNSEITEEELDELIEKMASIVIEKLGIAEEEIDWQKIEEWHFKETYNLVSYEYYLDFDEAKKIICKSKVSADYDWEDISSSAMDIPKINKKMIEEFKEYLENYSGMDEKELEEFFQKGLYIDFRKKGIRQ